MSRRSLGASAVFVALASGSACRPAADTHAPEAVSAPPPVVQPAAVTAVVPQVSSDPVVQRLVELGTTDNRVQQHLQYLTQEIGPRLTSSHNLMRAERWARDQFASWGLSAVLEPWGEVAVGFDRGPWSGAMIGSDRTELVFTSRAWTPGIHGPVRGGVAAYPDSVKAAKAAAATVKGKWIVHPARKPGEGPDEDTRKQIDEVLRGAGALGHVERDRDDRGELVHTGGNLKISWDDLPKDVRIVLRGDQHAELLARVAAGTPVELEFTIDNRFFRGPVVQNNVIAEIRGSEKPDEVVIVGGHLDSWDGALGTVDNGTGVSTTLEAARLLAAAGARPRRTIRFMLWGGEEQGLLGSRGWVEKNKDAMARISAVLVHDGGTNYLSGLAVPPEMMEDMRKVVEPVTRLAPDRMPFSLIPAESLLGGGSDHTPFIDAGVPGFFWNQDGKSNYRCMHHTQYDTFDAAIPEYQRHSAMVVAITAYGLANLDRMLDRTNSAPIPRRQLGVDFDGLTVRKVEDAGKAKKAGWRVGDLLVEVEGKKVEGRRDLYRAVLDGGPTKKFVLKRKGKTIESAIDFSDDPAERERARRQKEREQRFGPDVMKGATERDNSRALGDNTKSCKPGATG